MPQVGSNERGNIEVVEFLGKTLVLTAGDDNFLKFWSFEEIDDVEPEEDLISEIGLVKSVRLFDNGHVISVNSEFLEEKGMILVKCSNGKIVKVLFRDFLMIKSEYLDEIHEKDYRKIVESRRHQTVKWNCATWCRPTQERRGHSTSSKWI